MDRDTFKQLVDRAQSDASFFHSLVFAPEKVIGELEVGRREKGALIAMSPAEVLARLIGVNSYCGNTCSSSCDNTCGGSCGYTTNLQARPGEAVVSYFSRVSGSVAECGNTCTSSCDNTCGGSCGYTTNFAGRFGWQEFAR